MHDESTLTYDVIIVGAGPAGLSAGIRLKQLATEHNKNVSVCILEKGSEVGAHILSGAVLDPCSLKALLPNSWQQAPLDTPVNEDRFVYLTAKHAVRLPTPTPMRNNGNYIIRLGLLCQFLAKEAEALGCDLFPGFPAAELVYKEGAVIGVNTRAVGVNRQGSHKENYQPPVTLLATHTLLAEGCRGQLSEEAIKRFKLREEEHPQTYGLGIKELWRVNPKHHNPGYVAHSVGWPLSQNTYGGSFIYHLSDSLVALGFVVGLDYKNPYLSPFEEFQRFKTHPWVKPVLEGGERIGYGARALNEGGWQSMPRLSFPGGALIGDAAGFLNVPRIKGIHTAMQSGIIAAENYFNQATDYTQQLKTSWVGQELYCVRNIRPGFQWGLVGGLINAAWETYITRGHSPWTLRHPQADNTTLKRAKDCTMINYPKPDGVITFDRLSSVQLSNTHHAEDQPCHLHLKNPEKAIQCNYLLYAAPEIRYCPAAVYEIVGAPQQPRLQINASNCIHCKTCDIKDPLQNIKWVVPEGGGGPHYSGM